MMLDSLDAGPVPASSNGNLSGESATTTTATTQDLYIRQATSDHRHHRRCSSGSNDSGSRRRKKKDCKHCRSNNNDFLLNDIGCKYAPAVQLANQLWMRSDANDNNCQQQQHYSSTDFRSSTRSVQQHHEDDRYTRQLGIYQEPGEAVRPQQQPPWGMKVNSIYSQEHWRTKDKQTPQIFLTNVNEKNPFQVNFFFLFMYVCTMYRGGHFLIAIDKFLTARQVYLLYIQYIPSLSIVMCVLVRTVIKVPFAASGFYKWYKREAF